MSLQFIEYKERVRFPAGEGMRFLHDLHSQRRRAEIKRGRAAGNEHQVRHEEDCPDEAVQTCWPVDHSEVASPLRPHGHTHPWWALICDFISRKPRQKYLIC